MRNKRFSLKFLIPNVNTMLKEVIYKKLLNKEEELAKEKNIFSTDPLFITTEIKERIKSLLTEEINFLYEEV